VRVVFDTNVLIAAFLTEGVCSKLLVRARRQEFERFLSEDIILEFERNLRKKFAFSPSEIKDARSVLLEASGKIVHKISPIVPICRDPEDDKILACAKQTDADYLVTGDQDLLVIDPYDRTKIVAPRDFETIFEN
jgi:putative PIN family toxin of toxin-antitoxin system